MKLLKWYKNKTGGKGEIAYYIITAQRGYTSVHYHDFLKHRSLIPKLFSYGF